MNTQELITRAEHALRTNQPRVATLYMHHALANTRTTRAQHAKDYRAAQAKLRTHRMNQSLTGFLTGLSEIVTEAFQPLLDALRTPETQNDYTLAGPSKGSA